jgi:hypothetical protein
MRTICLYCCKCKRQPLTAGSRELGYRPLHNCAAGHFELLEKRNLPEKRECCDYDGDIPLERLLLKWDSQKKYGIGETTHINLAKVLPKKVCEALQKTIKKSGMVYVGAACRDNRSDKKENETATEPVHSSYRSTYLGNLSDLVDKKTFREVRKFVRGSSMAYLPSIRNTEKLQEQFQNEVVKKFTAMQSINATAKALGTTRVRVRQILRKTGNYTDNRLKRMQRLEGRGSAKRKGK